ncbi:MAG: HAMP domain-containing protein [Proteobacteria bacterium]|nr:HAMP domain-containing protein [Pseudomonadota bacterium]
MKRFVLHFLLGALAMLAFYEGVQHLGYEEEEANWEEAAFVTGYTHQRLREALAAEPAPEDALELESILGVSVVPITEEAYQRQRSSSALVSRQDGIELAVSVDEDEDWSVLAALPASPVSVDAVALFVEHDQAAGPSHLLSVLALLLGIVALGFGLIWSPARQLRQLAGTARALRDGRLQARAEVPRGGLVEPVARALNEMAERIQQVVEWQELVPQTVAHELRTPLARVRFVVERVAEAEAPGDREAALESLDGELTELEDLVSSVLAMVRADHGVRAEPVDLFEVVDEALDAFTSAPSGPALNIERVGLQHAAPLARIERAAVVRVFHNLLSNAGAHARQRVRVVAVVEADSLVIAVEDDGAGLPEDQHQLILEPFVRLDNSEERAGAGLGLTLVKRIVEAHGRSVAVGRSELGGLRVETRWPLARESGPGPEG